SPRSTATTLPKAASGQTAAPTTTTAPPRSPAQVSVLVANGTNVNGAANRIKSQLLQDGYNTVGTSNATTNSAATTSVYYVAGYQAEAALLAGALGLAPTAAQAMPAPSPVSDTKNANIVVVVGADLASQISSSSGPPVTQAPPVTSSHTTTTVHHTTTTVHHTTTTVAHTTTTA
ncbi:MAG TPA: LytR C-terminal domain-containing protein, partial [Acidimicrobiales bacterium]|nr:LytR C-terminal domain-containing protein [Acidimicrobiales bacterium]